MLERGLQYIITQFRTRNKISNKTYHTHRQNPEPKLQIWVNAQYFAQWRQKKRKKGAWVGLKFISVTEHSNYLTFSKSRNVRIQISTPSEFIYYRFYQMTLFGLHPWEFTCAVMFEKSTWIERQGNVNCILNMQWLQALSRFRWIYGLLTYIIHTICVSHSLSRTHSQHSTSGQLSVFRLLYVVYSSEGKAATVAACDGYVFFFFHYNTQY